MEAMISLTLSIEIAVDIDKYGRGINEEQSVEFALNGIEELLAKNGHDIVEVDYEDYEIIPYD